MRNIMLFLVSMAISYLSWCWLENPTDRTSELIKLGVLAILFLPVNAGGNVFTLFGSVYAEKNAYSLFSPLQSAGENAISIFGAGYQRAMKGRAVVFIGLVGYQQAEGDDAEVFIGLVGCQRTELDTAVVMIGLVGCQRAERAIIMIGLAILQNTKEEASSSGSLVILQKAGRLYRSFACFSDLRASAEETA